MSFPRDERNAEQLRAFHHAARQRSAHLQRPARRILTPLLFLLARVRITGARNVPSDGSGFILAANHPSVLDPFYLTVVTDHPIVFMGKSVLFRGWRGRMITRLGGFPVRRGVWDTDAFATARTALDRGDVMCMFPEGGVSRPYDYRPARPGIGLIAQQAAATVVPVHLSGTDRLRRRPWSRPTVRIAVGPPLRIAPGENPTPDDNQQVADRILQAIKDLA